jgi:serine/threonine protein kinase
VKPANVLLAGEPGEEHPYLTDFGLAKRLDGDSGLTHSGQWLGTVDYVAPEQLSGKPVDHRTDIYSLAVLLFEALTGEVPFRGDSGPAKMTAKLHDEPPSLCERAPWLPAALEDVLQRGMAMEPDDRYQSAGALGRALLEAVGESPALVPRRKADPGGAPPPPTTPAGGQDHEERAPVAPSARRRSPPAAAIVGGVLALIAVGVLAVAGVFSSSSPPPPPPPSTSAVSASGADAVVRRFGDAYRSEDLDAIMATLTDDVEFTFEGGATKTTKQGTGVRRKEFASQLALTDDYRLKLTGRDRTTAGPIVLARFSENVLSNTRTSGTVSFEVVSSGGKPLIQTISSKVD